MPPAQGLASCYKPAPIAWLTQLLPLHLISSSCNPATYTAAGSTLCSPIPFLKSVPARPPLQLRQNRCVYGRTCTRRRAYHTLHLLSARELRSTWTFKARQQLATSKHGTTILYNTTQRRCNNTRHQTQLDMDTTFMSNAPLLLVPALPVSSTEQSQQRPSVQYTAATMLQSKIIHTL